MLGVVHLRVLVVHGVVADDVSRWPCNGGVNELTEFATVEGSNRYLYYSCNKEHGCYASIENGDRRDRMGQRERKERAKKKKKKKRGRQSVAGEGDEVKGEGAVEGGRGGAYKRQKTRTDRILPRL